MSSALREQLLLQAQLVLRYVASFCFCPDAWLARSLHVVMYSQSHECFHAFIHVRARSLERCCHAHDVVCMSSVQQENGLLRRALPNAQRYVKAGCDVHVCVHQDI
jgi:hypothetical protein